MNVYTITLERVSTGETAPSLLHHCEAEGEARAYVEGVIAMQMDANDQRIAEIKVRPA
jgi:hypothetical protein